MIEQYGLGIFVVLVFVVLPALIAMILIFNIFSLILKERKKFKSISDRGINERISRMGKVVKA